MLKSSSILFLVCFIQFSFAQNATYHSVLESTMEWNTSNSGPKNAAWRNSLSYANKDTLINNINYKILNRTIDLLGDDRTTTYFIREDNTRKVFLEKEGTEYLLYDFNAQVGDTIWRADSIPNTLHVYYYINKIDYTEVNGNTRKQFHVKSNWVSPSGNKDWKWIEGLGDTKFGVLGFSAPDIGYGYKLCNVTNNNTKIFPTDGSGCSIRIDKRQIKFVPNPSSDFVSLYSIEELEFKLYDIFGRLRLIKPEGETKLDISNLEKGLYFTLIHISKDLKIRRSFVKL